MIIQDNFFNSEYNICNDNSSEPSRRDGSDEGSHCMVSMRNKNKYRQLSLNTPSYLASTDWQRSIINLSAKGEGMCMRELDPEFAKNNNCRFR